MKKMMALGVVLLCLLVGSASASVVFNGPTGSWNDPNLWSGGIVPDDSTQVKLTTEGSVCTVDGVVETVYDNQKISIASGPTGATLEIVDGGLLSTGKEFRVGDASATGHGNLGYVIQTGGTLAADGKLILGYKAGGTGNYTISGGAITGNSDLYIGGNGEDGAMGVLTVVGSAPSINVNNVYLGAQDSGGDRPGDGMLEFQLDKKGVSPLELGGSLYLDPAGADSNATLVITANQAPPYSDVMLVDVPAGATVQGTFDTVNGSPAVEGAEVVVRGDDVENTYLLTYAGGDGNDIELLYQSTAVVIGDFENGLDGWSSVSWDGNPGLSIGTAGATTGANCLDVNVTGGYWQLQYQGPVLDLREATAVQMDVTMLADDFPPSTWIKPGDKVALNGDSGWQEVTIDGQGQSVDRLTGDVTANDWGTWGDPNDQAQYRTLTYDISGLDLGALLNSSYFQVIIAFQGNGVFHIDNVRIIGAKKKPNVIWVSDNKGFGDLEPNTPGDIGWVDLLRLQGYNVDYRNEGEYIDGEQYWRTLDPNKMAELDAADLVIISRNADSGSYSSVADNEPNEWNAVTTPIINLGAHMARSNKWGWLDSTGTTYTKESMLTVVDPNSVIFDGVALDANNQVDVLDPNYNVDWVSDANTAGNGTVLATRPDGLVSIVTWEAGQAYFDGGSAVAGGPRMLFIAGTGSKNSGDNYAPDGMYNLTPDGETIFLNAVQYMLTSK